MTSVPLPAGTGTRRAALLALGGAAGTAALVRARPAQAANGVLETRPTSTAANAVQGTSGSVIPLSLRAAPGQTADLTQWLDRAGRVATAVHANGTLNIHGAAQVIGASEGTRSVVAPQVVFKRAVGGGDVPQWSVGAVWDEERKQQHNDFAISRISADGTSVDAVHIHEVALFRSTMSFNWSPPPLASTAFGPPAGATDVPTLLIRRPVGKTGEIVRIIASSGRTIAAIDADSALRVRALTVRSLTAPRGRVLTFRGLRISSPDVTRPNGLVLGASARASRDDVQLRNVESAASSANFLEVVDGIGARRSLSIRSDSGYVGLGGISDMLAPLDVDGSSLRLRTAKVPARPSAPGEPGTITWGPGHIYVCVARNTWRRVALVKA